MVGSSKRRKRDAHQRLPQVAVLLETSHEISRGMLRGVLNYVRLHGPWALRLDSGGAGDQRLPDLRAWRGSGIIARVPGAKVAEDIVAAKLPTVVIDPLDPYLEPAHPLAACSRVQCDSAAVARRAADHLLAGEFAHFAFVGEPSGMNWSRWRRDAFVARLAEAGRACSLYPEPTADERGEWELERRRMSRWLARLPKPLAVFAANDARGRQVLNACLAADLPVPYEVAVLGVNNDVMICETSLPPLSSVAVDMERAGYAAAEILDQLMRGALARPRRVTYAPSDVVARASTQRLQVNDRLVIQALEYVRINAGLNIRVSDVGRHCGVSQRWVEKRFAQTLGRSVMDEIQRVRLETVCSLVTQSALPFTEIARRCGFTTANHLGVLFKAQTGQTPTEARREAKAYFSVS
jgi:LacI family transcriptional regulator